MNLIPLHLKRRFLEAGYNLAKNLILTGLAKTTNAKLLLGHLVLEVHGCLAALHTPLASDG